MVEQMTRLDIHRAHYQPATIGEAFDDEPGIEPWGWSAVPLADVKPTARTHSEHMARQRRRFRASSHSQLAGASDADAWRSQFERQRHAKRALRARQRRAELRALRGMSNTPLVEPPAIVVVCRVCPRCGGDL